MLDDGDWSRMEADLAEIRGDNEISLAFRRKETTLAAQNVRVAFAGGRAMAMRSDAAKESRQTMFLLGAKDLDVAMDDRFTYQGVVYRVTFVQPNRRARTVAEAVAVQ